MPTKRCWRCWGRYILYELGRIGRLGRLGRFSLMVYFAHKATLALLGKVHISSLGGGSPLLFSLLTLLSTTPCFFLLLTPLLVSTCVSQVLGKERFPTINQILTRPSPSYVAVREMQKVREEEGEKGKGGRSYSARVCVIVSVTPLSPSHPLPVFLTISPSLTLSHLQCNTATGRDREHDTKPIYRRPPGCHHLGGYEAVNSGRTLK